MSTEGIVTVVDHDATWPEAYEKESSAILRALDDQVVRIHHIGSTSVPGLKAKPIVDILLEVKDVAALDNYNDRMIALGYTPKGEYGIPGRRFYLKAPIIRTHHVHAFDDGSPGALRHIAFRDYLIAHPDIAEQYGILKVRCALECEGDIAKYCDGKHAFVQEHQRLAIEWMERRQDE